MGSGAGPLAAGVKEARCHVAMTVLWFIVWLIANSVGGHDALLFDPVNGWTAALILAIGLGLGASHVRGLSDVQQTR
jgi:hypothetical protein